MATVEDLVRRYDNDSSLKQRAFTWFRNANLTRIGFPDIRSLNDDAARVYFEGQMSDNRRIRLILGAYEPIETQMENANARSRRNWQYAAGAGICGLVAGLYKHYGGIEISPTAVDTIKYAATALPVGAIAVAAYRLYNEPTATPAVIPPARRVAANPSDNHRRPGNKALPAIVLGLAIAYAASQGIVENKRVIGNYTTISTWGVVIAAAGMFGLIRNSIK